MWKRISPIILALTILCAFDAHAAQLNTDAEKLEFFETKIRPILAEHCYKCHSAEAEKLKSDLFLDSKEGILRGGESGKPAIVLGNAEASRLIEAIRYKNEDLQMPPQKSGGKLSEQQIADFV